MSSYVLILHEVDDYPAWKQVFDGAEGLRRDAGERWFQLLHADGDERQVVHLSRWTSLEAARQFFESDELVRIRAEAGVHAPDFHYLHELESGELPQ